MLLGVSKVRRIEDGGDNVLLNPVRKGGEVGDIEGFGGDLVGTVLFDKVVEAFLAATNGDDEDAACDHALSEGLADARGGTGDENGLVWERHFDDGMVTVDLVSCGWKRSCGGWGRYKR